MAQENNVRAVERALQILNCFAAGKQSFTLVEMARQIQLSPSTTLRLLGTLERQNFIFRDPDSLKYFLGFKLAQISHIGFANVTVCKVAHPFLEQLVQALGESAGVYIRKGERRVCVDRAEGTGSLRSVVQVGNSAPLTRGASGRLLLSALSEQRILDILEKDPCISLEDVKKTAQDGYAVSRGEREAGIVSIAAPVFNSTNKLSAAIFVSGPESRMIAQVDYIIPRVIQTAKDISFALGASLSDN